MQKPALPPKHLYALFAAWQAAEAESLWPGASLMILFRTEHRHLCRMETGASGLQTHPVADSLPVHGGVVHI